MIRAGSLFWAAVMGFEIGLMLKSTGYTWMMYRAFLRVMINS